MLSWTQDEKDHYVFLEKDGTKHTHLIVRKKFKKILIKAGLMFLRSFFKLSFLMCLTRPPTSGRGVKKEKRGSRQGCEDTLKHFK